MTWSAWSRCLTGKTQARAQDKLVRKGLDRINVLTENTPVSKYRSRGHAILAFRFQNLGRNGSSLIYWTGRQSFAEMSFLKT